MNVIFLIFQKFPVYSIFRKLFDFYFFVGLFFQWEFHKFVESDQGHSGDVGIKGCVMEIFSGFVFLRNFFRGQFGVIQSHKILVTIRHGHIILHLLHPSSHPLVIFPLNQTHQNFCVVKIIEPDFVHVVNKLQIGFWHGLDEMLIEVADIENAIMATDWDLGF